MVMHQYIAVQLNLPFGDHESQRIQNNTGDTRITQKGHPFDHRTGHKIGNRLVGL